MSDFIMNKDAFDAMQREFDEFRDQTQFEIDKLGMDIELNKLREAQMRAIIDKLEDPRGAIDQYKKNVLALRKKEIVNPNAMKITLNTHKEALEKTFNDILAGDYVPNKTKLQIKVFLNSFVDSALNHITDKESMTNPVDVITQVIANDIIGIKVLERARDQEKIVELDEAIADKKALVISAGQQLIKNRAIAKEPVLFMSRWLRFRKWLAETFSRPGRKYFEKFTKYLAEKIDEYLIKQDKATVEHYTELAEKAEKSLAEEIVVDEVVEPQEVKAVPLTEEFKTIVANIKAAIDEDTPVKDKSEELADLKALVQDELDWAKLEKFNSAKSKVVNANENDRQGLQSSLAIVKAAEEAILTVKILHFQVSQQLAQLEENNELTGKSAVENLHQFISVISDFISEIPGISSTFSIVPSMLGVLSTVKNSLNALDDQGTWTPEVNDPKSLELAKEFLHFLLLMQKNVRTIPIRKKAPGFVYNRLALALDLEDEHKPFNAEKLDQNSMIANLIYRIQNHTGVEFNQDKMIQPEHDAVKYGIEVATMAAQNGNTEIADSILESARRVALLSRSQVIFSATLEDEIAEIQSDIDQLQDIKVALQGYNPKHQFKTKAVVTKQTDALVECLNDGAQAKIVLQMKELMLKLGVTDESHQVRVAALDAVNHIIDNAIEAKQAEIDKLTVQPVIEAPKLGFWQRITAWLKRIGQAIKRAFTPKSKQADGDVEQQQLEDDLQEEEIVANVEGSTNAIVNALEETSVEQQNKEATNDPINIVVNVNVISPARQKQSRRFCQSSIFL